MKTRASKKGFTIVELAIVVVVIGIIATITIVAFGSSTDKAQNAARYAEVKQIIRLYDLYRSSFKTYPSMPNGAYCVGEGFSDTNGDGLGDCRNSSDPSTTRRHSVNTGLLNELKKIGSLPNGTTKPVKGGDLVGPYVEYGTGYISVNHAFYITDDGCPEDMETTWAGHSNGVGGMLCRVLLDI